jgi:hypothetical protein
MSTFDAIVTAIEDHRSAARVVRARRLEKRRLARALWAIEDHETIDAITEGPEEWDEACAALDAADEARRLAGERLCQKRPSCLDSAVTFFSYLASLGDELEPGLAEMASACASNALQAAAKRQSPVVWGPPRWWFRAAPEDRRPE